MIIREKLNYYINRLVKSDELVRARFLGVDLVRFEIEEELEQLGIIKIEYDFKREYIIIKCNTDYLIDINLDNLVKNDVHIKIYIVVSGKKLGLNNVIEYNVDYFTYITAYIYNFTINVSAESINDFYIHMFKQKIIHDCKILYLNKPVSSLLVKDLVHSNNEFVFNKVYFEYKFGYIRCEDKNSLFSIYKDMIYILKYNFKYIKEINLLMKDASGSPISNVLLVDITRLYQEIVGNKEFEILKKYLNVTIILVKEPDTFLNKKYLDDVKDMLEEFANKVSIIVKSNTN